MTNVGRWDRWYGGLNPGAPSAFRYGDTETYRIAAEFLAPCCVVEDRGVGAGGFLRLRPDAVGIDGSATPFASVVADLRTYRSRVDGVLLRHVIEHDEGWREILDAALASARERLALVLFTPFAETTHEIPGSRARNAAAGVDVPDIAFRSDDVEERFTLAGVRAWHCRAAIPTATTYGVEHVYRVVIAP